MKKLGLFLLGLGSLAAISVSASNYSSPQQEPQYQEQTQPAPCYNDTCTQLPCNVPDTVCAPCAPAPCTPAPCGC